LVAELATVIGCLVTRRQVVVARWRVVAILGLTRPTWAWHRVIRDVTH